MVKGFFKLALVGTFVLAAANAHARTMAEALGFSKQDKILIVHADDLGSIQGADDAARDLFKFGVVTSGSVMMDGYALGDIRNYALAHPNVDLGVHLTLTSEWPDLRWGPVSPTSTVPSLVASDLNFHSGLFSLFFFGRLSDVKTEMRHQIEAAFMEGFNPSHVDTHMGSIFLHPSWLKAYLNLAREFHVAPMIPRWSPELKQNFFGSFGGEMMDVLDDTGLFSASSIFKSIEDAGFLPLDHLYMFPTPVSADNSYAARKLFYERMIVSLKPGVSQIIIHPSYNEGQFGLILKTNPEQVLRNEEARMFQDPEIRRLIQALDIHLVTWRQVQQAYNWSQVRPL